MDQQHGTNLFCGYQLLPFVKEGMFKSGLHECGLSFGTVNGVEEQCMSSAEKVNGS